MISYKNKKDIKNKNSSINHKTYYYIFNIVVIILIYD